MSGINETCYVFTVSALVRYCDITRGSFKLLYLTVKLPDRDANERGRETTIRHETSIRHETRLADA
jgi:hypothetical protein